jgi:signal transduction histidine kinase
VKRLYARIYLHFVGVLLIVGLASSAVFAHGWRRALLRSSMERMARHLAEQMAERWPDADGRARLVAHLSEQLDMDLALRGDDGGVIAAAGRPLGPLPPDEAARVRDGNAVWVMGHFYAAAPVVRDGRVVATLSVAPPRPVHLRNLLRPVVNVALLLLVVGIATLPLARRISRPVERLTEASRRLGAGELGYRVPLPPRHSPTQSELEELTNAWNDMAERVERLVRGQKELLANVSHELRSPLARIRVALELLPHSAATQPRLDDVRADLGELERLVDDVLTTSRLEATGLPARLEPVDLDGVFAQLGERARHDPIVAGRELRLPAPPAPALTADGALVKRALWNLVENAAKYGAPPITLAARAEGDRVALTVSDRGPGIAPDERERVLDPFYRVDRAHTPRADGEPPRGFGLGLALARRIAEVHGGRIRIEAPPDGRGCAVTLELPARG